MLLWFAVLAIDTSRLDDRLVGDSGLMGSSRLVGDSVIRRALWREGRLAGVRG